MQRSLGFAFKDILQNWLAGVFILIRRPFHRGDQIKVGDIEGTVQAVETRATLVKTYAGKLVIIPNADIYTRSVTVNTAYPRRRVEISVPLGMGSDLREVIRIFSEAVKGVDHVLSEPSVDVLPWELRDNNVHVHVRWWTQSQRSHEVRTRAAVVAAIHRATAEHGIDIPPDDTISFADTLLYVVGTKAAKKTRKQAKSPVTASSEPDASQIDPVASTSRRTPKRKSRSPAR